MLNHRTQSYNNQTTWLQGNPCLENASVEAQNRIMSMVYACAEEATNAHKGLSRPNICILYSKEFEYVNHLFFLCDFSMELWTATLHILDLVPMYHIGHFLFLCEKNMGNCKSFPIFIAWGVYKVQNKHIFESRDLWHPASYYGFLLCISSLWILLVVTPYASLIVLYL